MKKALTFLLFLVLSTGAGSTPMVYAEGPRRELVAQGVQMQGLQLQGLQLRGAELRGVRLDEVRLRGVRLGDVRVEGGSLTARTPAGRVLRGAQLVGATLVGETRAGQRVRFAVRAVSRDPADPTGETMLYDLRFDGRGRPACRSDSSGDRLALPLEGVWDRTGARHESAAYFTFACTSGVLAKCVRWGYRPWQTVDGRPLQDYHQACTRLARADYCGDGRAHTREGTVINIYDDLGIQGRALVEGMYFEAAWTPNGAYCVSKGRLSLVPTAVLLGCPERVRLPRLDDLSGPDRCALRLQGGEHDEALLRNRSFASLR